MAYCPSCGEEISESAVFCPRCGARLHEKPSLDDASQDAVASSESEDELYKAALSMVSAASKLPVVRVNREEFLARHFGKSPYFNQILDQGPQAVFTPESLRKKATEIINQSTTKTAAVSFVSGLPSNPVAMVALGGADVVQYFGFAINLAQQLAYLFGEDDLFSDGTTDMPEEAKVRVIAYLGAMFGAAGAAQLVAKTSVRVGANLGKQVASKALTKTVWYPVVKKVGSLIGQKITKKTVEKTITKAVPIIGGAVSGAITFVTFRPMGARLADVFEQNLKGMFVTDDGMELKPDFVSAAPLVPANAAEGPAIESGDWLDGRPS